MSGDYHVLARFQREVGVSTFGITLIANLFNYVQLDGWSGRNILDAGCGTGQVVAWLAQHGYIVTGIDRSSEMLAFAESALADKPFKAHLVHDDLSQISIAGEMDLVVALNVLHETGSLRELGTIFEALHRALAPNKYFAFDVYTIEGLIQKQDSHANFMHDEDGIVIMTSTTHDYERQIHHKNYLIFEQGDAGWQRFDARLALRAYPVQAIVTLLQRTGFDVRHLLNLELQPYQAAQGVERVIIVAQKR